MILGSHFVSFVSFFPRNRRVGVLVRLLRMGLDPDDCKSPSPPDIQAVGSPPPPSLRIGSRLDRISSSPGEAAKSPGYRRAEPTASVRKYWKLQAKIYNPLINSHPTPRCKL